MRADLDPSGLDPRFRLDAFVARGAWGALYAGKDLETGAPVAVKRLHPHLCEPTMIARFEHEARLLAGLDSPYVVRHIAHGRDARERPYLVLEWLDGEDLARWKKARRAPRHRVVDMVRQAALGLAALHELGIVHGDVKPSNFFLVEGEAGPGVKLIDLGIARASGERALTATGFTLGTPAYLSPEQARGERSPAAASDLFSLGVVLFELFSGVKPYRGDDMVSLAMKIVLQDRPRLRDALPGAPPAVDDVVARAMGKAPGDCFPSALAFAEALAQLDVPEEAPEDAPELRAEAASSRVVRGGGGPSSGLPSSWILGPPGESGVITAIFARFDGTPEPALAIEGFREAAERHGGAFHHVLGPQRVAVFGGAGGCGDEAHRAAHAALAVATIPGVRLSIVTGLPVAGEGSLSGGLIERGLAEVRKSHGDVRIDETTARLVEGGFSVGGGKGERALAVAALPPDAHGPRLLGRPALLLGREREVAALCALFAECVSRPAARVILITGAPGVGKSRLLHELTRRAEVSATPPRVLRCCGEEAGAGAPFGLIGPALRELAGAPEAWPAWLAAACARGPLLLVLEDLHWGDSPSVSLVDEALREAKARPLLVVAAARPEVHERFPGLFAGRDLEERRLGPLTRKASETLVRKALGPEADDGVVRRLVDGAAGNALRLEQLVCGTVDEGPAPLVEKDD